MVVMDATTLMLLFHPAAEAPKDEATGQPITKCKERIELLLQNLSQAGIQVVIPTPALSEILVTSGPDIARVLSEISNSHAFKIQSFDTLAAVEVAMLTVSDSQGGKKLTPDETKAKVKYDRQIIAIAKVLGAKTIYSDDGKLGKKATAHGITVVKTVDLPLPPEPPQTEFPFTPGNAPTGDDGSG